VPTGTSTLTSERNTMSDCIDSDQDTCRGETFDRYTLSGSGMTFPRCDHHYDQYVERLSPIIDAINHRYPATAPDDFDPAYAGERWVEED
jgi:hypothetical protein